MEKDIKIVKVLAYSKGNNTEELEKLLKDGYKITSNTYCWHLQYYFPYILYTLEK